MIVEIHIGVMRACLVFDGILHELEAGQAYFVERKVVGAAGVANGQRGGAQVVEGFEPFGEDRRTMLLPWR
jgi:hypothetical protein